MAANKVAETIRNAAVEAGANTTSGNILGPTAPGQNWSDYEQTVRNTYAKASQKKANSIRRDANKNKSQLKPAAMLNMEGDEDERQDKNVDYFSLQPSSPDEDRYDELRPGIFAEGSALQRFAESKEEAKNQANEILDFINPANLAGNLFNKGGVLDPGNRDSGYYNAPIVGPVAESFMYHQDDSEKPERDRFDYDASTGQIIDRANAKPNEFEDRDTARARRAEAGEDMFTPEEGSYVDAGNGRVYNGRVYNKNGELDPAHPAIKDSGILAEIIDGATESANWLRDYISSWRRDAAEANADRKIRLSDGREIDMDDFLDSLPADYYDRSNSESKIVTTKPEKDSFGWSGGHYYIPDNPDLIGTDRESEVNWINVGEFSGNDMREDGTLVPNGTLDGSIYHTDSGFDIPVRKDSDGSIYPLLNVNWDIPAANPEDARAWTDFEDYTLPNGEKLTYKDMVDIAQGNTDIYNANNNDMLGLMATDDVSFMDDEGNFDFGSLVNPFKFTPVMTDAVLSTAPFMIPYEREALMYGLPRFAERTGIDPFSYDSKTGTYADPGSLSRDQYFGNFLATGADTLLEGMAGVAAKPTKGIMSGIRKLMSGSEQANKKAAERELKNMNKSLKERVGKTALEEAGEEEAALVGDQLRRGDWGNTFFADETGEFDAEGKPIYNLNTPISNRFWTGANQTLNDAGIGALLGGSMGLKPNYQQYKLDKAYLAANGNYLPVSTKTKWELSDDRLKEANDWYQEYLNQKENE